MSASMMTTTAKIPTVAKFCCYFELRTGGLIMGWFDSALYALILLATVLSFFTNTFDEEKGEVEDFSIVAIIRYKVVQVIVTSVLLAFAGLYVKGIYDNAPKKCLPYVILHGISVVLILVIGLVLLSAALILLALVKGYFFIVIYSVYKSMSYEGGHIAFEAHKNASGDGYEQFYEPEGYNGSAEGYNTGAEGYQTTNFQGP